MFSLSLRLQYFARAFCSDLESLSFVKLSQIIFKDFFRLYGVWFALGSLGLIHPRLRISHLFSWSTEYHSEITYFGSLVQEMPTVSPCKLSVWSFGIFFRRKQFITQNIIFASWNHQLSMYIWAPFSFQGISKTQNTLQKDPFHQWCIASHHIAKSFRYHVENRASQMLLNQMMQIHWTNHIIHDDWNMLRY